jgi:CRISPR-associated protein Csd1
MSWIQKLYETYENCRSMIGIASDESEVPLLPICHTTQKAQIEIVIDQDGNFKRAREIPKSESRTIIPCTESSGGRSSGEAPHPLCDKLQYVAADYKKYKGVKKPYFEGYFQQLKKWCDSKYWHPKAKAVLKYIEKGCVVKDLVESKIKFDIEGFVRWVVEEPGNPRSQVWNDISLFQSWINYYLANKEVKALCYISGENVAKADQHPRNIRRDGDGAKIISSNDTEGFTFLGRFSNAEQACGVGLIASHKAHNALRWLIGRQGYKSKKGDQVFVAWATNGTKIPDPWADPFNLIEDDLIQLDSEGIVSTAQELAIKLNKKISGYNTKLDSTTGIVVLGIDSTSSDMKGRIAITYYRELTGSDFLNRIENWHKTCCWIHDYRVKEIIDSKTGRKKKIHIRFVGAPAPNDIAEAAYGSKVDDKLRKATVERILPCIIDGQRIPRDLVESAVRRGSNRVGLEAWEWNKTLSIACALYRKYHEKEDFKMALDENRKSRDYLYGRLLALADSLEQWALRKAGEDRQTTAARLMQRFADHPFTTWRTIELALTPYKARLGNKSLKRQQMISQVMAMFDSEEFKSDKKLSGEFLLGYHCQREALWRKDEEEEKTEEQAG